MTETATAAIASIVSVIGGMPEAIVVAAMIMAASIVFHACVTE